MFATEASIAESLEHGSVAEGFAPLCTRKHEVVAQADLFHGSKYGDGLI
jgi:hypothetical protein